MQAVAPMATAISRKISAAVEMIHLTVSMVAFPRRLCCDLIL
jgi:hypothetical protein